MSEIIICANCGQKNRISANAEDSRAICAKCWTNLNHSVTPSKSPPPPPPPPPPKDKTNSESISSENDNRMIAMIIISVVAVIIFAVSLGDKGSSKNHSLPKATIPTKSVPTQTKVELPPEIMFPKNGQILAHTNNPQIAPLEIKTPHGYNYLVKLVSADTDEPVMTIFIHGGSTVTTDVPLGKYTIKYASGKKWYGHEERFGPNTQYSKANSYFTFEDTGYQITGYTITLYEVANGNLRTSRLSQSDF